MSARKPPAAYPTCMFFTVLARVAAHDSSSDHTEMPTDPTAPPMPKHTAAATATARLPIGARQQSTSAMTSMAKTKAVPRGVPM